MSPNGKSPELEGLRGVASLIVVVGHFAFVFFPYLSCILQPMPGAAPSFWFESWAIYPPFSLAFSAEAAVCVFFVMSGYVLTTRLIHTNSLDDLQGAATKRYLRLVLPTAASILFARGLLWVRAIHTADASSLGVAGWVPSWYTEKLPFFKVIYNAFIGAPLFGETALNAPVWTIQVELMGSILLFAMVGLFNKKPLYMLAWFLFFGNVFSFKLPNVLFYAAFLAGALLNRARPWLKAAPWAAYTLFVIGLVGLSFSLSPAFNFMRAMPLPNLQPDGPDFTTNPRLFWNTLGAIALVAGVIGAPLVSRMFSVRPLVHLGRISFSMYLLHMPLLMSVGLGVARIGKNHAMSYGEFSAIAFVAYVLSVIALAEIFCRYVDVPSIRLAARWSRPAAAKGREPTPEIVKSGIRVEPLTSQT